MNNKQEAQWNKYQEAEKDRIRSIYLHELQILIRLLNNSDSSEYRDWVFSLSRQIVDEANDFPIRMPLFEEIIFPVLYQGFINKVSGCARWLAGFCQLIYKSSKTQNILGDQITEIFFLREALILDPSDEQAKRKLIKEIARQLDFAIHEVPWGVLWGNNGATIEQCKELDEELVEFKQLVNDIDEAESYEELINECAFHFREYAKYLSLKPKFSTYSDYLSTSTLHT